MAHTHEKTFGPGRAVPLDRNAKARIQAYARAWSARHKQGRQHKGPITRAFMDVLCALLWGFHNSRSGACFPSYERIAARADCARSTVAEALKVLEWAGVLSWQHRLVRIREVTVDLLGHRHRHWRTLRSSNAYVFRDPAAAGSENPAGTHNQVFSKPSVPRAVDPTSPLERALASFGAVIAAKGGSDHEKASATPPATAAPAQI